MLPKREFVSFTLVDFSELMRSLPSTPTTSGGGYFKFSMGYSPIDLAVCVLSNPVTEVTNLDKWFLANPKRTGELYVRIGIIYNNNYVDKTIIEWKYLEKSFIKYAPLTFRKV